MVEYGVVEYRYSRRNAKVYAQLLADYGHTRIAPKPYTASAFIAAALGRLSDAGLVALQFGPATGYWSYNGIISYWALPPGPEPQRCWSWQHWAAAESIDPAV